MVIFGIRDLPRPRGDGFLFCKLYPNYREIILITFKLYNTKGPELKNFFTEGIKKLMQIKEFKERYHSAQLLEYDTDNIEKWAVHILDDVIKNLNLDPL